MDNTDKSKYDFILKNLNQQNLLGSNEYPTSITEANSVLNNEKIEVIYMILHLKVKQVKFFQIPGELYARNCKLNANDHQTKLKIIVQSYLTVKENSK